MNPYISKEEKKKLSEQTELSPKTISTWLSNKRMIKKRKNTSSNASKEILNTYFLKHNYIDDEKLNELSLMTKIPPRKILNFFRNRRYLLKKCKKKLL